MEQPSEAAGARWPPLGAIGLDRVSLWVLGLGVLMAGAYRGLIALFAAPASQLEAVDAFFFEPSASPPTLVFVISGWLFSRRWRSFKSAIGGQRKVFSGGGLLLAAVGCGLWAQYIAAPHLLLLSLIGALIGAALWLAGGKGFQAMALPAFFLFFAMPIPGVAINYLIYPLQLFAASAVQAILQVLGNQASVLGDRIYFEQKIFQVIESCSGLRGTLTLLMAAVLYLELFPRHRARALALVFLTPVLGLAINLGRILSIVWNPYSEISAVHTMQGIIALVVGVLAIAGLDRFLGWVLRDGEPDGIRRIARRVEWPNPRPFLGVGILLGGLAVGGALIEPWKPDRQRHAPLASVPTRHDGWQAQGLSLDKQFLGSAHYDAWVHRRYRRGEDSVDLLLLSDRRLNPLQTLASPKLIVPGSGWRTLGREQRDGGTRERATFVGPGARQLVELRLSEPLYPGLELLRGFFALDRGPWRRPGRLVAIRIATSVDSGPFGTRDAERRLEAFQRSFSEPIGSLLGPD